MNEGMREHEEMEIFIREFRTTNELLLKEQNNLLCELKIKVHQLTKVMSDVLFSRHEVKGVTTRGGKITSEVTYDKETNEANDDHIEPSGFQHEKLEEACTVTMNERCSTVLLNKLPSKEKDQESFTIPCQIGNLHIDNALADLGASDDEVIFDMEQSMKNPSTKDDECYSTDDLDETINKETQVLLKNERLDLFLLNNLEKSITQMDQENCNSIVNEFIDDSEINKAIRSSAIEIDEKKLELKDFPSHLEYVRLSRLNYPKRKNNHSCSSWVSPIHFVPNKGGITVVLNDNNELIPSRTVTRWRVCFDYHKLNDTIQKDHFPLQFIDQMLERLSGNDNYCFLNGFSGFFQIPIAPEDQEKTTFTCPYGTFAYRRMPFGLCNAPATFQRCMTAIFHDMVEDFMEVFMDDFFVSGNSFKSCLANLDKMLARCKETNLVLNWEKCHFMVKEGIVLGHKISSSGIEVDKAKINVIAKLPYPTNVKGPVWGYDRLVSRAKVIENQIMAAPVIAISSDSSDKSVGSPPSRVILFGDIPTVIPSTSVVAQETSTTAPVISSAAPVVETAIVASPTGLCGLVPYSNSDSDSPDEMDSPEYITPLPVTSPFLCTDSSKASDSSDGPPSQDPYVSTVARWRSRVIARSSSPSDFPIALVTAPPRTHR
ncbi:reverse transcriptase domain-containing protein [Tanacetum coccineum]|uniref:Reverse transcriptase domain-containing protein n=1 Tax=Tanacetum coccineum TaxID=301880 RepID=A0ABQ5DXR4_9ASTR